MRRFLLFLFTFINVLVQAQFTPGNLVVSRVGDGSTALSNASTQVQLVEFNKIGTGQTGVVRATLPIVSGGAGSRACTNSGSATSEGALSLSYDGRYLIHTGYDATPGVTSIANSNTDPNRVIARVDGVGVVNTSTSFTGLINNAYYRNNIRSACSYDGNQFWASGATTTYGGTRYLSLGPDNVAGIQINNNPDNTRVNKIFDNQLFTSSGSGSIRIATVGTGLPTTSGQTITNLNGVSTSNPNSPYGFVFFDRDPLIPGYDLLYYVSHSSTAPNYGLFKYSFNGTSWIAQGSIQTNAFLIGLTGFINCSGSVELFMTKAATGSSLPNQLISYVDNSTYNSNLTGNGGDINLIATVLASAGTNYGFRGVEFAPTSTGGIYTTNTSVPAATYNNIIVKSGATVTLTGDVTIARSLVIENGGTLDCNGFNVLSLAGMGPECRVEAGGTIIITDANGITQTASSGNVQTCNRYYDTDATYIYKGGVAQVTGDGLPSIVRNLTVDNASSITLTNPLNITSTLTLANGKINTNATNLLTLNFSTAISPVVSSNGSIYGNLISAPASKTNFGNDNSYINGPLRINIVGTKNVAFPVGSSSTHRPIFLNNATGNFTVEYSTNNPRTTFNNTMGSGLDHISAMEYWDITNTGGSAIVEPSFYDPNSGGVTNMDDLRVARFSGTQWDDVSQLPPVPNTTFFGTAGSNGSILSTAQASFGAFTLASATSQNPLPVKDIKLNYTKSNNSFRLKWTVFGDEDVLTYTVEKSNNAILFNTVQHFISLHQIGAYQYYYNTSSSNQNVYYRIKATLKDNQIVYSNIVRVQPNNLLLTIYPNPVKATIQLNDILEMESYIILNSLGNIVQQQKLTNSTTNQIAINKLPKGVYYLKVMYLNGSVKSSKFIKD